MGIWEVVYVTFAFKNDKGIEIEKTKTHIVFGETKEDAKKNFEKEITKFKKINSITEDRSNTLANLCPELIKLRNQMPK